MAAAVQRSAIDASRQRLTLRQPHSVIFDFGVGAIDWRGAWFIRPKGGRKFLAIPTGFNRQGGRRGAKPRISPQQMVASGQGFLRPFASGGGFVWCLPVRQGERTGRRRAPLIAGGIAAVATARRKGAAAWQ